MSGSESAADRRRPRVGIIDYRRGNLRSVEKAVEAVGGAPVIVTTPEEMEAFDGLILPGVGAFGDCGRNLREHGLEAPVLEWIRAGRPFLGICVGYQLLFEGSEESPGVPGLGLFPGLVRRFAPTVGKVPHMGWNSLQFTRPEDPLMAGLASGCHVYFVHSFYPVAGEGSAVSALCDYGGVEFAASSWREKLWGTQFHPEKSQRVGLTMLRNFVSGL